MRKSTRKVKKIAVTAMMAALSVVILTLGSVFTTLDLTMATVASFCVVLAVIEVGKGSAVMIYLATSILSLLIVPQKVIVAEYILFAGLYPLVKTFAEQLNGLLSWLAKVIFANLSLTLLLLANKLIFSLPIERGWMLAVTYLLVNATVIVLDIALTKLITFYYVKLQPRFAPLFKGIK